VIEYLNEQCPSEKVKWVVLEESGLYGFIDGNGNEFACADDDDERNIGIIKFLIKNGGSYISCG
jgi:hypothetical protein